MIYKNAGIVVRQPILSKVSLLFIEGQIDGFIICLITVEEFNSVLLDCFEILFSLNAC
jgi:hypothetical protein